MSMLAERKRKQKWSLNPRGKDWSEDSNKFGQKLLEKMGWSAGKGLGAKEDGITEHIKVSYKNDSKGMGYKETDSQWTEHESNFTQLLSSLSGGKENAVTDINEIKLESLEEKSQNSRARVHYHKFTRGKDLSRYSEKDLANIFGRKSLKVTKKPLIDKDEQDSSKSSENKSFGVETHNGGSMLDYFKKKLPIYKKYSVNGDSKLKTSNSDSENERTGFGFGFNSTSFENKVKPSFVSYVNENENGDLESENKTEVEVKKKKKSKKNIKVEPVEGEETTETNGNEFTPKKRKSGELECAFTPLKKKFKNFDNLNELADAEKIIHTPIKKNKKKKSDDECAVNGLSNPAYEPMFSRVSVERHSLEVINEEDELLGDPITEEVVENVEISLENHKENKIKKKRKKSNCGISNECFDDFKDDSTTIVNGESVNDDVPKKKSKKGKKEKVTMDCGIANSAFDENFNDEVNNLKDDSLITEKSIVSESDLSTEVPRKKSKKSKKEKVVDECGIANSAFDENFNDSVITEGEQYELKKKNRKRKRGEGENINPETEEVVDSNIVEKEEESRSKKKKSKKSKLDPSDNEIESQQQETDQVFAENPCFDANDSVEHSENSTCLYEVKRKKKSKLGIENPGLDINTPSPKKGKKVDEAAVNLEMPVMDDEIMLNVVSTPVTVRKEEKSVQRRKSVRFSNINQSIFINGTDSPADLKKNGGDGIDNEACDRMGLEIEENIDSLSKQLDSYQAEVENDLNEAKMEIMVGEMGDPNGENEILSNGDAKLKFKYANFGKIPPWLKKNNEVNARTSYRHLIKGDIILGFKNTNLHEIKGYGISKSNTSS
ncbi:hypothetical protein HHI36_021264 [Cryptolaemus montrouzieri]|uniref:G-patch domain-containing protein n=1 Tax=Cryptolaemus montrouzieri TaxID=559131 RepID=A0ABD2MX81_9CUCU